MIKVENLAKSFGTKLILKEISFNVNRGETIAIIGPSGSGKSTLIRCLNLLEVPISGSIVLEDLVVPLPKPSKEIVRAVRKKTGMVFQSFNLFPHLTAVQNVMQGLVTVQKKNKDEAKAIALATLEKVGLSEHANKYPSQLSGGQQQRVAIARAIALKPSIILMDEPTSALDPELVHEVLNVIRSIANESITLVIVTHELNFAREIAHRVMFMDQGEIVEFSPANEFFTNPQKVRTKAFLRSFIRTEDYTI